jgi:nucleoside-diphosphate-sugar epimerase
MSKKLLILGAGGYLGSHLIPDLIRKSDFQITAVSSQDAILSRFAAFAPVVSPVISPLHELPEGLAAEHDLVLNLAAAGVAHKGQEDLSTLLDNLAIAHQVCQLARQSRHRILLHFGSDTEASNLSIYLNNIKGMSLPTAMYQHESSMYSLSKIMQSSLIRHSYSTSQFYAHVIMTPNVYGGADPPHSLMASLRTACQTGEPFTIRKPSAIKRFVHINTFTTYVLAVLQDLLTRLVDTEPQFCFEVSSVDFVPRTTVAVFARRQWLLLGGDISDLQLESG